MRILTTHCRTAAKRVKSATQLLSYSDSLLKIKSEDMRIRKKLNPGTSNVRYAQGVFKNKKASC